MRRGIVVASAMAMTLAAWAQSEIRTGVMTVEFGHTVLPDGRIVDLKGLPIPYRAERIDDRTRVAGRPGPQGFERASAPESGTPIYRCDSGSYIVSDINEFPMPSVADDVRLGSNGPNAMWRYLTVGIDSYTTQRFLIRWQVFTSYVSGRGAGRSCFEPFPPPPSLDFGGYFQPGPGVWKVTFDIGVMQIRINGQQVYFAQQFRTPRVPENGQGPFRDDVQTVFSRGPAQLGFSENFFFYDSDFNGIYDETEVEQFDDGGTREGNMLLVIGAEGTIDPVPPISFSVVRGQLLDGGLTNLWFRDQRYVTVGPAPLIGLNGGDVQIEFTSESPTASPLGMIFALWSAAPGRARTQQVLELYNFAQARWQQFDSRLAPVVDTEVLAIVTGNPAHYVQPGTRTIRARVTYERRSPFQLPAFTVRLDQATWQIAR